MGDSKKASNVDAGVVEPCCSSAADNKLVEPKKDFEAHQMDMVRSFASMLEESPELLKDQKIRDSVLNMVGNFLKYHENIRLGIENFNNIKSICELEQMLFEGLQEYKLLDLEIFFNQLQNIDCEADIIIQKKNSLKNLE